MVPMLEDNLQEEDAGAALEQLVELLDDEEEQEYVFLQMGEDADFSGDDNVVAEMHGNIDVLAYRSDLL